MESSEIGKIENSKKSVKWIKIFLVALVLVVAVVVGMLLFSKFNKKSVAVKPPAASFEKYKGESFSLEYPQGWKVSGSGSKITLGTAKQTLDAELIFPNSTHGYTSLSLAREGEMVKYKNSIIVDATAKDGRSIFQVKNNDALIHYVLTQDKLFRVTQIKSGSTILPEMHLLNTLK